jgi:hypothetical protein
MKKYWIITTLVFLVLLGIIGVEWWQLKQANEKWETAMANVKAYDSQLGYEKQKNAAFQLSVEQLKYFNDSVLKALDETRKELKIKDKNLKALHVIKSGFTKKDTITITQVDTLFKEPTLAIDTLLGDQWYTLQLGLKYPSMIAVKPYFKSEKHIIVSSKKETVNPPKKFFLLRWLQKRHTVLHIDVIEKNPYVENENSKYVEIIK